MLIHTHMRRFVCFALAIAGAIPASAERSTDYQVELGKPTFVTLHGLQIQLVIVDGGNDNIKVLFNGSRAGVFTKHNGFDPHETETLLYSYQQASLYYVNTIPDHIGYCVLRIRSQ